MNWRPTYRNLILGATALFTAACAHSTIIPFRPIPPHAAVAAEAVEIYRSRGPFESFQELGAITVRSPNFDIPWIYGQLRHDAGAFGANAVIDLKIKSEQHTEWRSDQSCTPIHECNAANQCTTREYCTPMTRPRLVTYFVAVGTMIRSQK